METIDVGGQPRTYILHIPPSYRHDSVTALVIMLHGHGARAAKFERSTGMSQKADRAGFIVVYPQALGNPSSWHSGVDGRARRDDVSFLRTLIDTLRHQYNIDSTRVYLAGHSNGAFMAYRAGTVLSHRIAALGISAGSIGRISPLGDTIRIARPNEPMSVIAFHGKEDTMVPYNGGAEVDGPRQIIPVPRSISFWASVNNCPTIPDTTILAHGNVIREAYTQCRRGTAVILYTINNGTHRWPGDNPEIADEVSATDEMWAFFQAHPKR